MGPFNDQREENREQRTREIYCIFVVEKQKTKKGLFFKTFLPAVKKNKQG